ncbi:L-asparaginase, partial [Campylobacter upsaliensis]|nr:L-asparaginase [Campylobacter upsaliensis]
AGSIHEAQKEVLKELLAKGLKVAVSSRVVAVVWQDSVEDNLLKVL